LGMLRSLINYVLARLILQISRAVPIAALNINYVKCNNKSIQLD
jgi:hypothetical protein